MDLTVQVPIQYCFSWHWILLLSPDTSTTGYHIRFGLVASFILGLLVILLCSSPEAYWTPSDLGDSSLVSYLFGLWYSSWGSHGKYTGVVCTPSSCESRFVRTLWQMTHPSWVALHGMAHSFIELYKPFHYKKAVVREGDRLLQDIKYSSCAIQWVLFVYLFF